MNDSVTMSPLELVEWFNQVDASYRIDPRELNELNFSRFEAKLSEQRMAFEAKLSEQRAALEGRIAEQSVAFEAKADQR